MSASLRARAQISCSINCHATTHGFMAWRPVSGDECKRFRLISVAEKQEDASSANTPRTRETS